MQISKITSFNPHFKSELGEDSCPCGVHRKNQPLICQDDDDDDCYIIKPEPDEDEFVSSSKSDKRAKADMKEFNAAMTTLAIFITGLLAGAGLKDIAQTDSNRDFLDDVVETLQSTKDEKYKVLIQDINSDNKPDFVFLKNDNSAIIIDPANKKIVEGVVEE